MPILDFLTGLNHRSIGAIGLGTSEQGYSIGGSGVTADTTIVRRVGGSSIKIIQTGGGADGWAYGASSTTSQHWVGVCYVKFTSLPTDDTFVFWHEIGGVNVCGIFYNFASGKLSTAQSTSANGNFSANTAAAGPVLAVNVWYRLEIHVDTSANPWLVDGKVAVDDGAATSLGTLSVAIAATTATSRLGCGLDAATAASWTAYFTDIASSAQSADYPIGPISVYGYSPNSVGTHNLDASTSTFYFKEVGGVDTALTTVETTSYQTIDDLPITADVDAIFVGTTAGAPDTPVFRSAGTTTFSANNVANGALTPGAPAGKATGDLLVMICASTSNAFTITAPTGWTIVTGFPKASGTALGGKVYVLTRIADSTATDTPAVTFAGLATGTTGTPASVTILAVQNAQAVLDGTIATSDLSAQTSTSVIPAFTTVTNNSFVLGVALKILESSGQTSTVATFTERVDQSTTSGSGFILEVSNKIQTVAGSSGTATVTWSATGSARAFTLSLGFKATASITQPTGNLYAEYNFTDESVLTSAPLGVRAYVVTNLDTGVSTDWAAALADGSNIENIYAATITANVATVHGKSYSCRPLYIPGAFSASLIGGATVTKIAQSISGESGILDKLELSLLRNGSPTDTVIVQVQSDAAGAPSGTVLATSNALAVTTFPTVATAYVFTFSSPITLSSGTTYWLVISRTGTLSNTDVMQTITSFTGVSIYSGGILSFFNGTTWTGQSSDLCFALPWTVSKFNSSTLQFGLTASATGHPRLEGAMLEAAFVPSSAKKSLITEHPSRRRSNLHRRAAASFDRW